MKKPLPPYLNAALVLFLMLMCACTIKNSNVAGEQTTIKDTDWMLLTVGGEEVVVDQNKRTSYIHFESGKNKVKGFAGCNSFFGRFELNGEQLKLNELGSTRMSCPSMELETKLLDALKKVTAYSISGQLLTLYQDGNAVATFRAAYGAPVDQELGR